MSNGKPESLHVHSRFPSSSHISDSHLRPYLRLGTSSDEVLTDVTDENVLKVYLGLLRLIGENSVTSHESGPNSGKNKAMLQALQALFPGIDAEQYILDHEENPRFKEDNEITKEAVKKATKGTTIVQDVVAVAKADHRLPFSIVERMQRITNILKEKHPNQWEKIATRPLLLQNANDIMVYLFGIDGEVMPLYKPKISIEATDNDEDQRRKVFAYFQDLFADPNLPEVMTVTAKSVNAINDKRTKKGVVLRDVFSHLMKKPDNEGLRALIYGIRPETEHWRQRLTQAMGRSNQKDFWTAKQGINLKYVLNVNGGMKLENPLWAEICGIDLSPEQFEYYAKVVAGTPLQLEEGIVSLLELIAKEEFNQDIGEVPWREFSVAHLLAFEQLAHSGVRPDSRWVMLQERGYEDYTQPVSVQQRARRFVKVNTIFQSAAHQHKS